MLRELRIKDFAIIEGLSIEFAEGLNVLSGETGAGKSIIVDALGVALGERAYTEMIRTGAESASVEALFDFENFDFEDKALLPSVELGISGREEIILRRVISASGKSRAYINGTLVNTQNLLETGRGLVDIHGQHEHQSLLSPLHQLNFLDEFAGSVPEREKFSLLFDEVNSLREKISQLEKAKRERAQREDLLSFQANEIAQANLREGEEEGLEEERKILSNLSRLKELVENIYALLYEDEESSLIRLKKARALLAEMAGIDSGVEESLGLIDSALPLIEEAVMLVRAGKDRYEMDPARLDEVMERLELIKRLKKKYGETVAQVIEFGENARKELNALSELEEAGAGLHSLLKEKETEMLELGRALSAKREMAASEAEKAVLLVLRELAMEKADLKIELTPAEPGPTGVDRAEFMFTANPGENLKPLSKVASGGELSRLMLALKSAGRNSKGRAGDIPVLIFDEVDAGIGGATAENVARKLKSLARTGTQVLCITHLPQIASAADAHYRVEKDLKKDRASVRVDRLKGREREEEIARMLGGKLTGVSLKHARELIERRI
jgi:DNA repair protein RecN (Recombination protein N)